MNLVIDIGNSSTKIAIFDHYQITDRISTEKNLVELISNLVQENPKLDKAIISSVSRMDDAVVNYLDQHFKCFLRLSPQTPVPVENCYGTPETLGLDRLAAAVGANYLFPETDLLVIDAGTAITYDIVNRNGQFLGGNISPGINARFRSLHEFTHQLPLVEIKDEWQFLGNNTKEAIRAGVQNGVLFEIDAMIDRMKEEYPKIVTILTGGNSFFFDKKLKNTIFVQFEITLIGLNRILEYNYNAKK